jgi:serine/threonine protein kinase
MSEPVPKSLGRYELLQPLGQGGMGEVHLARSLGAAGFEKLCIVKTILPRQGKDPQFVERFLHEARVLVQLTHSNIAQVYDMGEADGQFFMAIEYVAGVDVARLEGHAWGSGGQVPIPVALQLGQKIAEALGYAHRKTGPDGAPLGIVHRDVSPQNAMVSYEGEVKVIDFGLAKSAARSHRTQSATVLGKFGYLSPEQARAERVDFRSDIYSCGIVVWELLAGRPLFESGSPGEMLARMANPKVPSLAELRPEVSPELARVVERALAADPTDRYARADDFSRALNERAVRDGLTLTAEELGTYVRDQCATEFADHRKLLSRLSSLNRPVGDISEPLLEATAIRRTPAPAEGEDVPLEATAIRRTPQPTNVYGKNQVAAAAPGSGRTAVFGGADASAAGGSSPASAVPVSVAGQNTGSAGSASSPVSGSIVPSAHSSASAVVDARPVSSPAGLPPQAAPPPAAASSRIWRTLAIVAGLACMLLLGVVGGMRLGGKGGRARPAHPARFEEDAQRRHVRQGPSELAQAPEMNQAPAATGPSPSEARPKPAAEPASAEAPTGSVTSPSEEPPDAVAAALEELAETGRGGVRAKRRLRRLERLERLRAKQLAEKAAQEKGSAAPASGTARQTSPEPATLTVPTQAPADTVTSVATTQSPVLPSTQPAPRALPDLTVNAKLNGSGSSGKVVLQNLDESAWSNCVLKLPDQRRARLARLDPYASTSISLSSFQGPERISTPGSLILTCNEGTARVKLR